MEISLSKIRMDGGTQSRAGIDPDTVSEYADAIHAGAEFPPPVVFFDGENYWLADGFHRLYALRKLTRHDVECRVMQGTRRDAILYSVGANATHGKRRTNADKRIAVETLLKDEQWSKATDLWIADKCGVSHPFVGKLRSETMCNGYTPPTRERRDGTEYTLPKSKPATAPKLKSEPVEPAEPDPMPRLTAMPQHVPTAPRPEPAPAPIVHRDVKPDNASLPPAKRDVEGERRHLFTLLPTDRRLADALWTVGQLTASEQRELLSKFVF